MELKELVGIRELSAVDVDGDSVMFMLDGVFYKATENPDDGYRSYLDEIEIISDIPKNTFAPIPVLCSADDENILEVRDKRNGQTILRVGTDDADAYYPCAILEWSPERIYYK